MLWEEGHSSLPLWHAHMAALPGDQTQKMLASSPRSDPMILLFLLDFSSRVWPGQAVCLGIDCHLCAMFSSLSPL